MSNLIKRSIRLNGHPTSVAVEPEFWSALTEMADAQGLTLPRLIQEIDRSRTSSNLSSALRIAVLRDLRSQAADR